MIRNYIIIVFAWQLFRADISQVYHCNSFWCTDVTTLADAKANKFVYVFSGEIILPVVLLCILEKTSIDQPPKCKDLREDKEAEEELGPDGHPVPWHYVTMPWCHFFAAVVSDLGMFMSKVSNCLNTGGSPLCPASADEEGASGDHFHC